jgi:hyaluronoglucosaminidase
LVYGRIAADAHIDLTDRLARKLRAEERVWFAPTIFSDEHLDNARLKYSEELLGAIVGLDSRVGIVWSGPKAVSPSIVASDVSATRARFGGRPMLLDDRYPANGSGERLPLALVLGPIRERDPALADGIAAYVSTPMGELGGSRLALLTVAAFLTDPHGYDADEQWRRAMKRLAGDDADALAALSTQALEWGGWVGTANYHTALDENPQTAAQSLRDPAAVAFWSWPVRTYPGRMAALEALDDTRFRDDVLLTMARRLAVARAVPVVREILSVSDRTQGEKVPLVDEIRSQRQDLANRPEVLLALDRFLLLAGIGQLIRE